MILLTMNKRQFFILLERFIIEQNGLPIGGGCFLLLTSLKKYILLIKKKKQCRTFVSNNREESPKLDCIIIFIIYIHVVLF